MKQFVLYIIGVLFCVACTNSTKSNQKELVVYCAASLTNVINELADLYESKSGIAIQLNFASSGTLARQIEHGAQPSIYISANEKWVDYLIGLNLLLPESKQNIAGNSLVLVVPLDSDFSAVSFDRNLKDDVHGRIAIGDPKHVPAGEYAWQAIENIGLANEWKEKILPAKDVRSALILVELGEVELGIVYKTDALRSERVKLVAEVAGELHGPISLFSAMLNEKDNKETRHFSNFLQSNEAKNYWQKHGFKIE